MTAFFTGIFSMPFFNRKKDTVTIDGRIWQRNIYTSTLTSNNKWRVRKKTILLSQLPDKLNLILYTKIHLITSLSIFATQFTGYCNNCCCLTLPILISGFVKLSAPSIEN